eukprot:maker-scaffold_107-snap-gene-0.16-mRNA-1 protein AED:0.52 eAED:0.63 QI:0/0/0/1/0/0/3/0/96
MAHYISLNFFYDTIWITGSIPEREPERRLPHPRKAAGATFWFCDWNELNIKFLARNNWRASLVPAAAVIPAPVAYIKVAAKKLVVESPANVSPNLV